jgi:iron complex outermembrane receptor protein
MASRYSTLFLLGSASLLALCAAARAQGTEEVTVSASRISIEGYQAPTPVTVLDFQTIENDAKVDLGDSLRELPSVGQSDSPSNGTRTFNASPGDSILDTVELRNLGTARTLVLFDGQRVVTSNTSNGAGGGGGGNAAAGGGAGGVDLASLPKSIIERVDIVTGGASAAWGSDAVAGVVNLVINKKFEGFKANLEFGDTGQNDRRTGKIELTAGTDFLGDRGHIEIAGDYTMSPDTVFVGQRSWWSPGSLFPATTVASTVSPVCGVGTAPMCVYHSISGNNVYTQGGLITASAAGSGPTAAAANALRGIEFGVNGTQTPFNFGTALNQTLFNTPNSSKGNCYNCSATEAGGTYQYFMLAAPYHATNLFGYTSYQVTDNITASFEAEFGATEAKNVANPKRITLTIKQDNAYLDPGILAQMQAGGIPNFSLGTNNVVGIPVGAEAHPTFATMQESLGYPTDEVNRQLTRGVFKLEGKLGDDWSWNVNAQHSQVRERMHMPNNMLVQNYNNAVDAVRVTATGADSVTPAAAAALAAAGAPVPQVGSIACRSSLTSTSWGVTPPVDSTHAATIATGGLVPTCVPLNVFGTNVASLAAINYISPGRTNPAIEDQLTAVLQQTTMSASGQGVLPWGLPAGRVAVAFGGEYRLEQQRDIRDPLQIASAGGWLGGNFGAFAGQYNVKEGFLEINAPILKDNFVQSLDFNAAGRYTSYSTSGDVQTWKLGVTSQLNDDIRVRTSWSFDIRAPYISELFSSVPPGLNHSPLNSPFAPSNGAPVNLTSVNQGNSLLQPENATTVSGGAVLTPHWIEGLTLSLDWYSISMRQAVYTAGAGQIVQQCFTGSKAACGNVLFGKGASGGATATSEVDGNGVVRTDFGNFATDFDGALNFVSAGPVNVAAQTTSGLDFAADYQMDLFSGRMGWHVVGNYNDELTRTQPNNAGTGLVKTDGAGALGGVLDPIAADNQTLGPVGGPKLRFLLSATYSEGPWVGVVQTRFLSSAKNINGWVDGVNVDNNEIPAVAYLDLRLSYRWNDRVQLYGAVDNTFDTPPPIIPNNGGDNGAGGNYNTAIYDGLGRQFRVGLRFTD